jgi:ribosomal protein L40E
VTCRSCGATIADKALICYKCGTATTEAKYQPVSLRPKRSGPTPLVIAVIVAALLIAVLYYLGFAG